MLLLAYLEWRNSNELQIFLPEWFTINANRNYVTGVLSSALFGNFSLHLHRELGLYILFTRLSSAIRIFMLIFFT